MPDRQVSITVSVLGLQDASNAARGFTDDVKGIGGAAADAATKAVPLTDAIDKTATSAATAAPAVKAVSSAATELASAISNQLAPAGAAAQAAFQKLGDVTGIRGLSVAIVQATMQMEAFKKSTADAEAAGTKMPPAVGAALATMQTQVDGATARLGGLKAGMSEVQTRSIAMGEGWRQAATSGGSLNSMLLNLAEGTTGATSALAKLGLGTAGVVAAFKVGTETGNWFNKEIDAVAAAGGRSTIALAGLAKIFGDLNIAGQGFKKWADEAATATKPYADELDSVILKVNTLMKVHQEAALRLSEDEKGLKALGVAWEDPIAKAGRFAEELKRVTDTITQNVLKGASLSEVARDNAKELEKVRQGLEDEGKSLDSVDPKLKRAILLAEEITKAHEKHALSLKTLREADEQLNPAIVKILETLQLELDAAKKSGDTAKANAEAHDKATLALAKYGEATGLTATQVAKLVVSQGFLLGVARQVADEGAAHQTERLKELGSALDDAAAKTKTLAQEQKDLAAATKKSSDEFDAQTQFIKNRNAAIVTGTEVIDAHGNATETAQNKEGHWEPIWLKVTAATEAQNKALTDLLKTTNAYTDSLDKTLTVASGWKDYLAQLVDAYQSGSTSLLAYKNALAEFQTQLLQLFGGATGKAKDAINDITRAIQNLINTAGAGGPVSMDWSIQSVLDKTFNKPPVKP